MKTLYESLLDDFDDLDKDFHQNIKNKVWNFLIDNYKLNNKPISLDDKKIKIGDKPNKDGKYVVDVEGGIMVKNHDIYTLTNDLFVFGKIDGYFGCEYTNITSLEGAPEEVGGYFSCINCNKLKNLDYLPKKIGTKLYVPDHLEEK